MKIKVLQSSLDKGEKWAAKNSRKIEICKASDTPDVYFGIYKKNILGKEIIVQDFFLTIADAEKIGAALLAQADKVKSHLSKQKNTFAAYKHL